VVAKGLCDKHRQRVSQHGSIKQTRANDWGSRTSHPLYGVWNWHSQRAAIGMVPEWANNFDAFITAIEAIPEGHTLRRKQPGELLGPNNWYFKETTPSKDKAAYARKWRKEHPRQMKDADLKKHYGITIGEYERMLDEQGHKCLICGNSEYETHSDGSIRYMPVDHDHATGKIRGLLCGQCNKGLGAFKDDINLLNSAIVYLNKNQI